MLCYIGAGSNLGDRLGYIRKAIDHLRDIAGIHIGRISPVYETPAEGGPVGQPHYLNLVLELTTDFLPEALLGILKDIEKKSGRLARPQRWAEREIDLDILLFGTLKIKKNHLVVPHPMLKNRYFVLKPLSDLAPGLVMPGETKTVASLLSDLGTDAQGRLLEETL